MWWSVLLAVGSLIVVLLIAWRLRRYRRDVGDELDGEYRDPPLVHSGGAPH